MSVQRCGLDPLRRSITNLLLSHKLLPVEAYEFPQESVADFWKEAFAERGIMVFGRGEVPAGKHRLQMDFVLPDEPPEWMLES